MAFLNIGPYHQVGASENAVAGGAFHCLVDREGGQKSSAVTMRRLVAE